MCLGCAGRSGDGVGNRGDDEEDEKEEEEKNMMSATRRQTDNR